MQAKTPSAIASFPPDKRDELFNEIIRLYDLASEVLGAIMQDNVVNRAAQLALAKPFVEKATHSVNILSALYTEAMRKNRPVTPGLQETLEKAFHSTLAALGEFAQGVEAGLLPQVEPIARPEPAIDAALPKRSLGAKFREGMKAGTVENKFRIEIASLSPRSGAYLVQAANHLSDQWLAVAVAFDGLGLIDFKKAVPAAPRPAESGIMAQITALREVIRQRRDHAVNQWEACAPKVETSEAARPALGKYTDQLQKGNSNAN